MNFERRDAPRYHFSATAEICGASPLSRIGRVKDLSVDGCYIAIPEPFPEGFEATIKITTETESFQCQAVVARASHGIGMGMRFNSLEPQSRRVLEAWLHQARGSADAREEI